jgi:hypothetical protein
MLRKKILLIISLLLIFSLAVPVFAQSEKDKDEDGEVNAFCLAGAEVQHPVGKRIAAAYELEYEEVMKWFCQDGYGFGQILLALRTSSATDLSPEDALGLKTSLGGWGKVWKEHGLIGRPAHAGNPAKDKADKIKGGDDSGETEGLDELEDAEGRKGPPPWAAAAKKDKKRP